MTQLSKHEKIHNYLETAEKYNITCPLELSEFVKLMKPWYEKMLEIGKREERFRSSVEKATKTLESYDCAIYIFGQLHKQNLSLKQIKKLFPDKQTTLKSAIKHFEL